MKIKNIIIMVFIELLLITTLLILPIFASYTYYNDFSQPLDLAVNGGLWRTNFMMGREGITGDKENGDSSFAARYYNSYQQTSNGWLTINGDPYTGAETHNWYYNGFWNGIQTVLEVPFNATEEEPFGFEITRLHTVMPPRFNPPHRSRTIQEIWLFVDNGAQNTWDVLNDYINIYDLQRGDFISNFFGVYDGTERDVTNFNFICARQTNVNCYDIVRHSYQTNATNTTDIGFKITHDGSHISVWINPSPNGANAGYPDEWCRIYKKAVDWSTNMKIMIGHTARDETLPPIPAYYDNLRVFSAADESKISLSPQYLPASANVQQVTLQFTNTIRKESGITNAGINYIRIIKPDAFTWGNTIVNAVTVHDHYTDSAQQTLTSVAWDANSFPAAGEVMIRSNGNEIQLYFGTQITNMSSNGNEDIFVDLDIITGYFSSGDFTAYIEAKQLDTMPGTVLGNSKGRASTCGEQKCTGTANLTAIGSPQGYAGIDDNDGDNTVLNGLSLYTFLYTLDTTGISNGTAIGKLVITIPPGAFNVIDADSIVFIDDNDTYTTIQSINGTNRIVVNYSGEGKSVPGENGIDIIRIDCDSASLGRWMWPSYIVDIYGATNWTITNTANPRQWIEVAPEGSKSEMYISYPGTGDPRTLFNQPSPYTNRIEITIRNVASDPINIIRYAVIEVPDIFSNLVNISSSRVSGGGRITYTPASGLSRVSTISLFYGGSSGNPIPIGGQTDKVQFTGTLLSGYQGAGGITNVYFSALTCNSNNTNYQRSSTSGQVTNIVLTDPQPIGSASVSANDGIVYATESANVLTYRIVNAAPTGDILYAGICIPSSIVSNISTLSSSWPSASPVLVNGTNIRIDYSGNNLTPGGVDQVQFTLTDRYTNSRVYGSYVLSSWVGADAVGSTNATSDEGSGATRLLSIYPQELRAMAQVTPRTQLSEVTGSYWITNYITNSGDAGNYITEVRIDLPGQFNAPVIGDIDSGLIANEAQDVLIVGNDVWLYYTNNLLNGGSGDTIRIRVSDNVNAEASSVIGIRATVNTNILDTVSAAFSGALNFFFEVPPPRTYAWLSPNIQITGTTNRFTVSVSNYGSGSNNVERLLLTLPSIWANQVSMIGSSSLGLTGVTNYGGSIAVNYAGGGNTLDPGERDVLTIEITNTSMSVTNGSFGYTVWNNEKTAAGEVLSSGSLRLDAVSRPEFRVSPLQLQTISAQTTNTVRIFNGSSSQGVPITMVRLPVTASGLGWPPASVSAGRIGAMASWGVSGGTNIIYVDYSANPLPAGEIDDIQVIIPDSITTPSSAVWSVCVEYGDAVQGHTNWFSASVDAAGNDTVQYVLPAPVAPVSITPGKIYVSAVTDVMAVTIDNQAPAGSELQSVRLQVPSALTNGLTGGNISGRISGSIASTISYDQATRMVRLTYNPGVFTQGIQDDFTFTVHDSITGEQSVRWTNWVSNIGNVVENTPSAVSYILAPQAKIIPVQVPSSVIYTNYQIGIENPGGGLTVQKVLIAVPSVITNMGNIVSSAGAAISNYLSGNGTVVIDYSGVGGLPSGNSDTINFDGYDNLTLSSNSGVWEMYADGGSGYALTRIFTFSTKTVEYYIPSPSATASITPSAIDVSADQTVFTYTVLNTGSGQNAVCRVVIDYDTAKFTNTTGFNLSAARLGASETATGTNFIIDYSLNPLGAGEQDTITFTLSDIYPSTHGSLETAVFSNRAYNVTNRSPAITYDTVSIAPTQNAPAAYISSNGVSYTLDSSTVFVYTIENRATTTGIDRVEIAWTNSLWTVERVSSTRSNMGSGVTVSLSSTNITLQYNAGAELSTLTVGDNIDYITIGFSYSNTPSTAVLRSRVNGSATNYTVTGGSGRTQTYSIQYADFGRIEGRIRPANKSIRLSLLNSDGTDATNRSGIPISAVALAGSDTFRMDFVPAGTYQIQASCKGFFTKNYFQNITVTENTALTPSTTGGLTNTMSNEPVVKNNTTTQTRQCHETGHTDTKVVFPAGTVPDDGFVLNIYTASLTNPATLAQSECINASDTGGLQLYEFDIEKITTSAVASNYQYGLQLDGDVHIQIQYSPSALGGAVPAVYYYDAGTDQYVNIGGKVTAPGIITVNVQYLHTQYIVAPDCGGAVNAPIDRVSIDNNPFTPGDGDGAWGSCLLSFRLKTPQDTVNVRFFTRTGIPVREITVDGSTGQGMAAWDGTDNDGYPLPAGVYIYQILLDSGEKYTGSILLVR